MRCCISPGESVYLQGATSNTELPLEILHHPLMILPCNRLPLPRGVLCISPADSTHYTSQGDAASPVGTASPQEVSHLPRRYRIFPGDTASPGVIRCRTGEGQLYLSFAVPRPSGFVVMWETHPAVETTCVGSRCLPLVACPACSPMQRRRSSRLHAAFFVISS